MSSFSESVLQEKLSRLTSSQESIETLSLWIIHHKQNAEIVAQKWFENFLQAQQEKRITLFYLINDIVQNSRRKNITVFAEVFRTRLKEAIASISGLKAQTSIERIIHIWRERNIFEESYLNDLDKLLEGQSSSSSGQEKIDFKVSLLEDCLVELGKFEGEMKIKESTLSQLPIDVSSTESLTKLKDKASGDQFKNNFHNSALKLEEYVDCTSIEVTERTTLLDMLGDCKMYLKREKNELESLLKDYKQLQNHLASLNIKLKDKINELDKAQHTATSDPTSKTDITLAGDMEIDSDSETAEETPSIEPQPLPPPPPVSFVPPFPSTPFIESHSLQSLPPHSVPYSPSMPKPYTPLTPHPVPYPNFPTTPTTTNTNSTPSIGLTTPTSLDDRLKGMSTKTLPDSFFHDYSDSSDEESGDKPYSPSNPITTAPTKDTPTNISFYGSGTNGGMTSVREGVVTNVSPIGVIASPNTDCSSPSLEATPTSRPLSSEDFKIIPSLTNILGEIFPRLSKNLEERKRRGQSPPTDNKYSKTEYEQDEKVPQHKLRPPIDHAPEHYTNNNAYMTHPPSFEPPPIQYNHFNERFRPPMGIPRFPRNNPPFMPPIRGPRPPYYNRMAPPTNSLRHRYY